MLLTWFLTNFTFTSS
ncbi:hypothetical protein CGLO_12379 [Colletotrichum gloeosporioides Cg-14]|uniref:Uncharacterized protein n=1 Tax=Colletotrichum gloeosporioides (strain Cg-14) TaxID=1237896 RepID=T0JYQ9_COLGC|nr:hypothetical protein CGLO_12379 [Colletotrichum gloeosporioides Cg-14]